MELALARLVGAGLTLVFEGFEESVPPGAVENGLRLIQHIAKQRPDVVVSLTEGVVKDIWKEWRQAKLPTDVAIAHIEALPEIMDTCRSSDGMMLGAVAAIQVARRIGSAARPVSHSARVATAIIGRALETGQLTARGLNESIAFFFLDRLLARLMPDQQLFLELRPMFLEYLDSGAWRTPMPAASVTPPAAAEPAPATPQEPAATATTAQDTSATDEEPAAPAQDPAAPNPVPTGTTAAEAGDDVADAPSASTQPAAVEAALAAALSDETVPEQKAALSGAPAAQDPDTEEVQREDAPTGEAASETAIGEGEGAAPVTAEATDVPTGDARDVSPAIPRIATDAGAPVDVLAHVAQRAAARLGHLPETTIEDLAAGLADLIGRLSDPADTDPAAAELKRQAARSVRACDLDAADRLLDQAEAIHVKAAPLDMSAAHGHLVEAASTRACRGQLEEMGGDFRRAARHYAAAARCLGDNDRRARRSLLMRQAGALVALGEMAGETSALAQAAQVYADAGRLLSEQDAPLEWAVSHLELGRILMELGERESRPERYLAAALHFKPASDVFSRQKQADNWARAQLGLADALRAQGEVQGDVVTLSEAAFAYRAALGVATRERMPLEWALASSKLAATLLRLDHETGETAHHDEAAMALRAVLAAHNHIPDAISCSAQAKLAQALIEMSRVRGESWLEDEAIEVLRSTRTAADQALKGEARAKHDDHVGSLLHQIGEARRSTGLLAEASELKLAALDHFQAHGHNAHAERIRSDLNALEQAVEKAAQTIEAVAAA